MNPVKNDSPRILPRASARFLWAILPICILGCSPLRLPDEYMLRSPLPDNYWVESSCSNTKRAFNRLLIDEKWEILCEIPERNLASYVYHIPRPTGQMGQIQPAVNTPLNEIYVAVQFEEAGQRTRLKIYRIHRNYQPRTNGRAGQSEALRMVFNWEKFIEKVQAEAISPRPTPTPEITPTPEETPTPEVTPTPEISPAPTPEPSPTPLEKTR